MDKTVPPSASNVGLEQFLLLSKNAKGAAAAELVRQATEAPGVYVFGELIDMPNIKELANGPHVAYFHLLNIFAYGTYSEYRANQTKLGLPLLTPSQATKLRHLTIVSLAIKNRCLPYTLLLKELEVANLRELEDLIIEVIYADIVRGKLDQKHQLLEVDFAIGRDIRPENFKEITTVLEEWCTSCEALLVTIESQVKEANRCKDIQLKENQKIEQEVTNLKKTLKTTHQQDMEDQHMMIDRDMHSTTGPDRKKFAQKGKSGPMGLRGSTGRK